MDKKTNDYSTHPLRQGSQTRIDQRANSFLPHLWQMEKYSNTQLIWHSNQT